MASLRKKSKLKLVLFILAALAACCAVLVLTLLAIDAFTIPYLSPFAHFIKWCLSPFVPFYGPFLLGTLLRLARSRHTPFKGKAGWTFVIFGSFFQRTQGMGSNIAECWGLDLDRAFKGEGWWAGIGGMCGLVDCYWKWLEEMLLVLVVVAELRGWRWDFGCIERWIDSLLKEEAKFRPQEEVQHEADESAKSENSSRVRDLREREGDSD